MLTLFLNPVERRLRAGWRLLLWVFVYLILTTIFSALIPLILVPTGGLPNIGDPGSVIQAISSSPPGYALSIAAVLAGTLISVYLAGKAFDRRRFADFGFHFNRRWWIDFAFGLFLGAALMAVVFAIELAAGWVTITGALATGLWPFGLTIVLALLNFISVGITEELIVRGYLLRNLAEGTAHARIGRRAAVLAAYLVTSSIFGLLHMANPHTSLTSTVNLILAGLFLGLAVLLTGELAIPIGIHITWNFFQGNVFGFPVSGTHSGASFIAIQQSGPLAWTGGAFGPEAGLIGVVAMLLGIIAILAWLRLTRRPVRVHEPLAQPPAAAISAAAAPSPAHPQSIS